MQLKVTETFEKTAKVYYDDKYRQIVSVGGSRSSKSYSILQILMLECIKYFNIKITVWRNTKVVCRSTVMEDFQNIIMFDDFIFKNFKQNKQTGTFTYKPTGSRIVFEGADNIGKVLGGAQHISFFNEITEFSKDVYLQITQRTSGKVICDYNPSKDFWLEKYKYDKRTVFIHSTFKNNSFCAKNIVEQLKSYEPWKTDSYYIKDNKPYYNNKPVSILNQPPEHEYNVKAGTADKYMWLVYGLGLGSEKPNKIYHNWKKITDAEFYDNEYDSYFGLDFGSSNPTACVEVKYNGDNSFYIKKRLYKPMTKIEDSLPTILNVEIPDINNKLIVCDSAKQTYINILKQSGFLAVGAIKGGGSVESGITLIQSFNIMYVDDEDLDYEYNNYSWNVDRYNLPTEAPIKKDDHLMDAMRYIITYLVPYLNIKL